VFVALQFPTIYANVSPTRALTVSQLTRPCRISTHYWRCASSRASLARRRARNWRSDHGRCKRILLLSLTSSHHDHLIVSSGPMLYVTLPFYCFLLTVCVDVPAQISRLCDRSMGLWRCLRSNHRSIAGRFHVPGQRLDLASLVRLASTCHTVFAKL